jgi:pyruvate dehydrogenase E1 component alpha subunit/2-oxoisovalerate dehydrogenase E1 component alpha subunit
VDKAAGYGVPGVQADGNDVLAVYEVTKSAVDRARAGHGPTLVELITFRRKGHAEHDNQSYVTAAEIEAWEKKDPLDRFVRRLTAEGWAAAAELEGIDRRIGVELDRAVAECENDPPPAPESALDDVYANPRRAETEWYRRLP